MKKYLLWLLLHLAGTKSFTQSLTQKIDNLLQAYYSYGALNGCVLVGDSNGVIYEKAFGKSNFEWNTANTLDSKFEIASVSKLFTDVIIFQLIEEGKLTMEGKVSDYYKEYPGVNGNKITIRQLLTHTSGLTDSRFINDFEVTDGMIYKSHADRIKYFAGLPLLSEPGAKWSYSNFGYQLLAFIAEKVTGRPFRQLLKERIFDKTQMNNSFTLEDNFIIPNFAPGYNISYSGIEKGLYHDATSTFGIGSVVTTVYDYYLFWRALNHHSLLSKKYTDTLFTPVVITDNGEISGFSQYFDKLAVQKKDSITILRSAGNHYGVHTLSYNIKAGGKLIAIFLNAKNTTVNIPSPLMFEMADNITRILYKVPVVKPKNTYARVFFYDEEKNGIAFAKRHYLELKKQELCREHFRMFNQLGYYYLEKNKFAAALEVFKLNIENYPLNGDGYDSIGELYLKTGNKKLALINYKKALELDPANENARMIIAALETEK